jgi:hypothetical protein
MPMTNDELNRVYWAAGECDLELFSDFEENIGWLAELSEGELYAFAGMLLSRGFLRRADIVARYARSSGAPDGGPGDPKEFLAQYRPNELLAKYIAAQEAEYRRGRVGA